MEHEIRNEEEFTSLEGVTTCTVMCTCGEFFQTEGTGGIPRVEAHRQFDEHVASFLADPDSH